MASATADPPVGLTGTALTFWTEHAPDLVSSGLLSARDVPVFRAWCETFGELTDLQASVPVLQRDARLRAYLLKLRGQAKQLSETLGLTPTSRNNVRAVKGAENQTPKDPRQRFLGRYRSA